MSIPSLNQLPKGEGQHLCTATSSSKRWPFAGCPCHPCWWQQVSSLLALADQKAPMPRVRLPAAPRARTSNAQPKYLCAVKTANYFSSTPSWLYKYSALAGKSFLGCSICRDVCQRYLFVRASEKQTSLACTNRIVSLSLYRRCLFGEVGDEIEFPCRRCLPCSNRGPLISTLSFRRFVTCANPISGRL